MEIALELANCFLIKAKGEAISCEGYSDIIACTAAITGDKWVAFMNYFSHLEMRCYFEEDRRKNQKAHQLLEYSLQVNAKLNGAMYLPFFHFHIPQ